MRWFHKGAPGSARAAGQQAEDVALRHLQHKGLRLVLRNYRTPGRGGGEIDLIMREPDGTLVFVEVRWRRSSAYGGAAASIGVMKRQRIIFAARHFLLRQRCTPPARFDVVVIDGDDGQLQWLRAAFDAGDAF